MTGNEFFLLGIVVFIAAMELLWVLFGINKRSEAEDAEQRRAVSKPMPLENELDAEQLRKDGLL